LPPALASIYAYINPIIAVFLGWLVLDERLNLNVGFGTVVTIAGVYLVNNEFRKQLKSRQNQQKLALVESEAHT
jgi:drug/metabolite transporter (DMT)-like permease